MYLIYYFHYFFKYFCYIFKTINKQNYLQSKFTKKLTRFFFNILLSFFSFSFLIPWWLELGEFQSSIFLLNITKDVTSRTKKLLPKNSQLQRILINVCQGIWFLKWALKYMFCDILEQNQYIYWLLPHRVITCHTFWPA